jgi:DNA adenine methylase
MKPILRWIGGKQRQLKHILPHIPKNFEVYHEPFVGGGALFFHLEPEKAHINDVDDRLMDFYNGVVERIEDMIKDLKIFQGLQNKDQYSIISNKPHITPLTHPHVYYYLNKVSYNAMMRFNRQGQYNVPYGKPVKQLCHETHLRKASKLLAKTERSCKDYTEYFMDILYDYDYDLSNHLFYIDPPYPETHAEYLEKAIFVEKDIIQLRRFCDAIVAFGATVIVSLSVLAATCWRDWERHDIGVKYTADRRRKPLRASQAILIKKGKSV